MENGLENPGKFPGETMNNFIICQANESRPISSNRQALYFLKSYFQIQMNHLKV